MSYLNWLLVLVSVYAVAVTVIAVWALRNAEKLAELALSLLLGEERDVEADHQERG